jgi:hypothetical protein
MKRVFKIIFITITSLCVSALLAGCVNNGAGAGSSGSVERGALQAFEYNYGSFHGGDWNFSIKNSAEEGEPSVYIFTAEGFNGVDMNAEKAVGRDVLDDLAEIISENGIAAWNGFAERNDDVLDGYSFGLKAEFGDETIIANGYEKYPENYTQGHEALAAYLERLAE